jgi:L-arabinose isomerase
MKKSKIGLLPLYIELYDKSFSRFRPRIDRFYGEIADALRRRGSDVATVPVCRLRNEFKSAIATFEKARVDVLVTIHLAYSPSLESAAVLAKTKLPIVVLDTTPTFDYGPGQDPAELMYNHGIHGVQDMCNLLIRNGKRFEIVAGHWQKSNVLDRVAALVQAARLAGAMRTARVGLIGTPFKGMGDFAVPAAVMKRTLGVETIPCRKENLKRLVSTVSEKDMAGEMAADRRQFKIGKMRPEAHRRSARLCVAIRRWIEKERLTAFTVNFLAVDRASGLPTVPFLEAGKAMARGIGYAGEGDVLTAALVGALASVYPDTSFTEMFCPDWKGNRIFLSHMGEMNPRTVAGKATLVEMDYSFSDTDNPIRAVGCFRGGPAAFVNLAPLPGGQYRFIVAPVKMEKIVGQDRMDGSVHGWFKPAMPIDAFLAEYSKLGGTHHAALVYGNVTQALTAFGAFMGWDTVVMGK